MNLFKNFMHIIAYAAFTTIKTFPATVNLSRFNNLFRVDLSLSAKILGLYLQVYQAKLAPDLNLVA